MTETIFALATSPGRSGIAVLRVSGPNALKGLIQITQADPPPRRTAALRTLRHPVSRETLDRALILTFLAPASYTGEDLVEYHLHGSRAVVSALYEIFSGFPNHRPAQPGELTRRAFQNGKMDLTEAEAVADLIDAETQAQRLQALNQMNGTLTALYEGWRERLVRTLAHLEADLDFPDEELPEGLSDKLCPDMEVLQREIDAHLNDSQRGERLRDGIRVVILGAPNAGKSTLINALTRREVSIVSDLPGTTRDRIEIALDIGGYPVLLSDTAGLRPDEGDAPWTGHEAIERQGINRALEAARTADIRILLFDGQKKERPPDPETLRWANQHPQDVVAVNKMDSPDPRTPENLKNLDPLPISAKTGQGLDALLGTLTKKLTHLYKPGETPTLTRARHRQALERARDALNRAQSAPLPELVAEDLRLSARALGEITGRVDVDDLLDVIFRDFCIGK